MKATTIRSLNESAAEALFVLRREALTQAPLAFLASPKDDLASSVEAVRAMLTAAGGPTVIGAFDKDLVGMAGLYRERHLKATHKVNLWGFYVQPRARRQGLGARLLSATLNHARQMAGVTSVRLGVSEAAPEAKALYEGAGFRVWGREPEAICHDGRMCIEEHMNLDLQTAQSASPVR